CNYVPAAIGIMGGHPDKNIEQLLSPSSDLTDDARNTLKNAIRRAFERRQIGSFARQTHAGNRTEGNKFDAYSRLICCMEDGDSIVSFNYDNAFEYVLSSINSSFQSLNLSELSQGERIALELACRDKWIPGDIHAVLTQ